MQLSVRVVQTERHVHSYAPVKICEIKTLKPKPEDGQLLLHCMCIKAALPPLPVLLRIPILASKCTIMALFMLLDVVPTSVAVMQFEHAIIPAVI